MENLKTTHGDQPAALSSTDVPNWQTTLWREWRNCDDEDYATRLFQRLIDEPINGQALFILALLGAVFGSLKQSFQSKLCG